MRLSYRYLNFDLTKHDYNLLRAEPFLRHTQSFSQTQFLTKFGPKKPGQVIGPARALDLESFTLPPLDFHLGTRDHQAEFAGDELNHRPLAALATGVRRMSYRQVGRT